MRPQPVQIATARGTKSTPPPISPTPEAKSQPLLPALALMNDEPHQGADSSNQSHSYHTLYRNATHFHGHH